VIIEETIAVVEDVTIELMLALCSAFAGPSE
jgi:hypothetical protein